MNRHIIDFRMLVVHSDMCTSPGNAGCTHAWPRLQTRFARLLAVSQHIFSIAVAVTCLAPRWARRIIVNATYKKKSDALAIGIYELGDVYISKATCIVIAEQSIFAGRKISN